jgi:hypothetical protein
MWYGENTNPKGIITLSKPQHYEHGSPAGPHWNGILNSKPNTNFVTVQVFTQNWSHHREQKWKAREREESERGESDSNRQVPSEGRKGAYGTKPFHWNPSKAIWYLQILFLFNKNSKVWSTSHQWFMSFIHIVCQTNGIIQKIMKKVKKTEMSRYL